MTKRLATCLLTAFLLVASACGGGQQADDAAPDEAEGERPRACREWREWEAWAECRAAA